MAPNEKFVVHGAAPRVCLPNLTLGQEIYSALCRVDRKRLAVIDKTTHEQITYGELLDISLNLAEALKLSGYSGQHTVLGICSENSIYFNIPVFAAMFTATIIAPVNHDYMQHELEHTLKISQPKVVFCSIATHRKLLTLQKKLPFIEQIVLLGSRTRIEGTQRLECFIREALNGRNVESFDFKPVDGDPAAMVAFIQCSSGTTGLPKGVMLSHRNLMVRMTHSRDPQFETIGRKVALIILPMFHAFGMMTSLESFLGHKTVITMNRFDENLFLQTIQDHKVPSLFIAPPIAILLSKTTKLSRYDLSSVKEFLCGAAPLSKSTEDEVMARFHGPKMRQGYGLTEATMAVTMVPNGAAKHGSVGQVLPYMKMIVRNPETGEVLGPCQVGEICLKGPMLMLGYYKNPEATKESFTPDGWLKSGDLGYFDEDKFVYVIDRLKELIKYKGYQVAPAELEALLVEHPKIKDTGVVGLPDDLVGERPLAFVVKKEGMPISEEEIQKYISDLVSPQKRLSGGVIFVEAIPKNPSGKILRRELRNMLKQYDIKPKVESKILKNAKVRQIYGMTEMSGAVTAVPLNEPRMGSVGKIFEGLDIKIIDPSSQESVGPYVKGEICIRGPQVMKGYLKNEADTKNTIDDDGFIHSGDIGYMDNDGFIFIVDRIKELIKYKAYQVAPAELESVIINHKAVKDVGVVGKPDERCGELPTAFVVKYPSQELSEQELCDYVAENLSLEKHLNGGVIFVKEIPKTASGKVLRRELRKMLPS